MSISSLITESIPLPDFYIAGFRKCGTTTLFDWLSQHPDICSPEPKEPNVLAFDDIKTNEFTFFEAPNRWKEADFDVNAGQELKRYSLVFKNCKSGQLKFDATPNYVLSGKAVRRIKELTPNAKFIFILRHPTKRAYSDYLFALRQRRAAFSFEKHMRYESLKPLTEGHYFEYLKPWFNTFSEKQILILTLEGLKSNPEQTIQELSDFLKISPWNPNFKVKNERKNFRFVRLQYLLNLLPKFWNAKYNTIQHWPIKAEERKESFVLKYTTKIIRRIGWINLNLKAASPEINMEFEQRLNHYFERENRGLSDLTGLNFKEIWNLDI